MLCRSYYRCTNRRDQGCPATKLVQQEELCGDAPMFRVTYTDQHTCEASLLSDATSDQQIIFNNSPPREANFFIFESKSSFPRTKNVSKQQQHISLRDQSHEKCSSVIMSLTSSGSKKAEIKEETSSTSVIEDFQPNRSSWDFDFEDLDSILNSLL